jgi:cold shock CspA family protein
MRTARPSNELLGTVLNFHPDVGLGVISVQVDGEHERFEYPVHCTQVDGGSRLLIAGTTVRFSIAAGHRGRWDAVDVQAEEDSFLCPVCGAPVDGEVANFDICQVCDWEDDPVARADPAASGGANGFSLDQARRTWRDGLASIPGQVGAGG